ncbi:unnamed protein product [Lepeophtheirus salmonis]|uniref:(salmon louse) hypothetical protein n=1 Tax=Lepeophtheirus salmonis TaxID=72036 RepID=A0A7R8DC00_LEPSM|nr:unnamed protein product [Lepeophtheirus salmonis]CAF3038812.1 unnamed protein product [Lepeophtheirus salmonis]
MEVCHWQAWLAFLIMEEEARACMCSCTKDEKKERRRRALGLEKYIIKKKEAVVEGMVWDPMADAGKLSLTPSVHEGSVTKAKAESSSSSEEEEEILGSEPLKKKGKKSRNPKIYSCPTCCRSFTTKGNLEFHVNSIHLRITAYECNICSKVFAQAGNLKTHLENVHAKPFKTITSTSTFKCINSNPNSNPQQQRLAQQHSQQQTFHPPPAQIEIVQNPLLMDPNAIQHLVQASNIGGIIGGGKPKRKKNFIPLQTISETDLLRQGVQVIQAPQHVTVTALDGTPGGTPLDLGVYHQPLQSQSMASKGSKKKETCLYAL